MEIPILESITNKQVPKLETWQWMDLLCEESQSTMDRDRELFEEIKTGRKLPILRFYRWKKPTVSYGRTQGIDESSRLKYISEGFEVVKRPTGGGKVVHTNDVCFSITWRKEDSSIIPWKIKESYYEIHKWIRQSLKELGIEAYFVNNPPAFPFTTPLYLPLQRGEVRKGKEEISEIEGWCFENPIQYDLFLDGRKIVGGAQWREKGTNDTALHQGSIQVPIKETDLHVFKETFCEMFSVKFNEFPHSKMDGVRGNARF